VAAQTPVRTPITFFVNPQKRCATVF